MKEQILKKTKFIMSIQEECRWLEEMAQKGWFFTNITMGVRYTFKKGEPRKVVYDIDRFDMPKKPTLEDINAKEIFMEMAEDMGWKEVTHDETMTYYFVKDYEEGGINEIHNDEDTRKLRAEKYSRMLLRQKDSLLGVVFFIALADLLNMILEDVTNDYFMTWYNYFSVGYIGFFAAYSIWVKGVAEKLRTELSMSREQWEYSRYNVKKEKKFILTNRGLTKYLAGMAKEGWMLTDVTAFNYSFRKSDVTDVVYTIDAHSYTMFRHKDEITGDKKDWYGMNADWQIQSVKDAEELGWSYVCSLENKTVIYSGNKDSVEPLNDKKFDNSFTFISWIGKAGVTTIILGLIGFVIGFTVAMLTL